MVVIWFNYLRRVSYIIFVCCSLHLNGFGKNQLCLHNNLSLDLQNAEKIIDAFDASQSSSLLPTIKVFCDWLLCNKKIIQSISNVPTSMWSKLAVLLNLIPHEKQIASKIKNIYSFRKVFYVFFDLI